MNDQDYIKRGVELADGWAIHGKSLAMPCDAHRDLWDLTDLDPCHLDALAAQLVRQVDATGRYRVETDQDYSLVHENMKPDNDVIVFSKDRTMNTIKAIVDSGVVE